MTRQEIIDEIFSNNIYKRFQHNSNELEIVINTFIEHDKFIKNLTVFACIDDYTSFHFCEKCNSFKDDYCTRDSVFDPIEFPIGFDKICNQCYQDNRY